MADVKFYMSSNNYPVPESGIKAGALYFNSNTKTIYYGTSTTDTTPIACYTTAEQETKPGYCTYAIGRICNYQGDVILYGKRCATKDVSIPLNMSSPPMTLGDSKTVYTTITEDTVGGAFIGYDISEFVSGVVVPNGSGDYWSKTRMGVQVGTTESRGTPSYKIGAKIACTATIPQNALISENTSAVILRVYYIPF